MLASRAAALLAACTLATGAASPRADTLRVIAGGRDSTMALVDLNGARMVEAGPLVRFLGGTLESRDSLRYRLRLSGLDAELMAGLPFFKTGETAWPLSAAPALDAKRLFVPLQLVADLLPRLARDIEYDRARGELRGPAVVPTATPVRATPPAAPRKRVVVVDAGHGGTDPGMRASLGGGKVAFEKTINLGIAQKLAVALRDKGFEVVMTRTRDTLISLSDRGAIANKAGGHLFLSVHVNASGTSERRPGSTRGFETYFLSEARTEDERRVAAMENEAVRYETDEGGSTVDGLSFLLNDMAQNEHLRESSDLAETIQRHLGARGHPGPDRGVKQAEFVVLIRAFMPAVLIETGYGTNQSEARWLASGAGQSILANAIANAATEYLRNYDRRTGINSK
jgi:N-acetylmuramoyl-L-alanine amidase